MHSIIMIIEMHSFFFQIDKYKLMAVKIFEDIEDILLEWIT